MAGAEFGNLLGIHGREYLYPQPEAFDHARDLGLRLVRLPFKWERLQPQLGAPFAKDELGHLRSAVAAGLSRDLIVVLDPHNYGKRRLHADGWTKDHEIGTDAVPSATFALFWADLAAAFAGETNVHFGLMNEPVGQAPDRWCTIAQEAMNAIRERGARNMIYVPGTAYTGAHSWLSAGNGVMSRLRDPADAYAIEVHQYLDANSSGTGAGAVSSSIGSERLAEFQDWARANGVRAFLGEFAAADNDLALRALADMLTEVSANADIWTGVAAWAGGSRWPPDDMFNLERAASGHEKRPAMILASFAREGAVGFAFKGRMANFDYDNRRPMARNAMAAGHRLFDEGSSLEALFASNAFTMLVEARRRDVQSNVSLVSAPSFDVLRGGLSGFHSELTQSPVVAVPARLPPSDSRRIRCALTINRDAGTVQICATGGQVAQGHLQNLELPVASLKLSPSLIRVIGFDTAFNAADLRDLVA